MLKGFFQRKIVAPVVKMLKQGISQEKVALSIAWGVMLGIFPVLGTTTILCAVAAVILRLNLPIIQLANWLVYPLQLAFLFPFFFAGAYLFGSGPLTHDAQELIFLFQRDLLSAVILLKDIVLHAVLVWLCMAPVAIILLYWVLKLFLKKIPIHRYPTEFSRDGFPKGQNNPGDNRGTP
jgi:uncharacterized protein (DUF2062 family)